MVNDGWTRVAAKSDVPDGSAVQVEVGGCPIALYNIDGKLYATHDTCTHGAASLAEGYIEGEVIECPLHQGRFHIPSGKALGAPVTEPIRTYETRVEGEDVFVKTKPT